MSTSTIVLPANFVSDVLTNTNNILSSLSSYITLILGVILGVVVIEIIINALRK